MSVSTEDAQAGTPAEVPLYDEFDTQLPDPHYWPLMRLQVLIGEASVPGAVLQAAAEACGLAVPDHTLMD